MGNTPSNLFLISSPPYKVKALTYQPRAKLILSTNWLSCGVPISKSIRVTSFLWLACVLKPKLSLFLNRKHFYARFSWCIPHLLGEWYLPKAHWWKCYSKKTYSGSMSRLTVWLRQFQSKLFQHLRFFFRSLPVQEARRKAPLTQECHSYSDVPPLTILRHYRYSKF